MKNIFLILMLYLSFDKSITKPFFVSGNFVLHIHIDDEDLITKKKDLLNFTKESKDDLFDSNFKHGSNKLMDPNIEAFKMYEHKSPVMTEFYDIEERRIRRQMVGIDGLYCLYEGFFTMSNNSGLIIFQKIYTSNNVKLLITNPNNIDTLKFQGNVAQGIIVKDPLLADLYNLEEDLNEETQENKITCTKINLENNTIPNNTIILLANKDLIYFKETIKTDPYSTNTIFPPLYGKKEITRGIYAASALDLVSSFKPLDLIKGYISGITPSNIPTTPNAPIITPSSPRIASLPYEG